MFHGRGIALPLPKQGTVDEPDRYERGHRIQHPIYGDETQNGLASPEGLGDHIVRYLTEFCFSDFYTRNGLDIVELLVLCVLAALGDTDLRRRAHAVRASSGGGGI